MTTNEERDKAIELLSRDIDRHDSELDELRAADKEALSFLVEHAVREAMGKAMEEWRASVQPQIPTDQERDYLRLAIKREARRGELQKAVIEKSLAGLVWAGLVWLGYGVAFAFKEWLKSGGFKV